ncbi:hypothetical protein DSM104440_00627 [Usitatibacter palustris]|uniref:Uncharacterized protein n=1 Tax=Usitatibacter palustris TaxID=2732487 RepID=A0A6M4H780_9PROT|nr:hypothetical protein DSM104440_00627 [Usitatibacter palustris]
MERYSHVIEFVELGSEVVVYRLYSDGRQELLTRSPFPNLESAGDPVGRFAKLLGESLILDSPIARSILKL